MVFSSIPSNNSYLDPPSWPQPQQQNQQPADGTTFDDLQLLPPPRGVDGSATSAVKPGSMVEQARLAKIPPPEAALKCPRCESTNTKFCYFNNYSLSQPRHFCKTCRRYWTRGGALRNVPVGGGCRRNKRSKTSSSNRSKSPVVSTNHSNPNQASSSTNILTSNASCSDILGHVSPQLPLLPPLLGEYNSGDMGLDFRAVLAPGCVGTSSSAQNILEQFRFHQQMQQFPFLTSLETPPPGSASAYSFGREDVELLGGPVGSKAVEDTTEGMANMKMEGNQGVNLSRNNYLGIDHHQFWDSNIGNNNTNAWADLSGFTSSSTNHNSFL